MCLAVITSEHPDYAFILLSNRDEVLERKTRPAEWWESPNEHVLGGRDLQRSVQGTWLGITKQGRLAVLTNFREEGEIKVAERSRGDLTVSFLTLPPASDQTPEQWAYDLVEKRGVQGMGGFSLIFGELRRRDESETKPDQRLGIISNRTPDVKGVIWVTDEQAKTWGQTCALSNSHFGDKGWPKVVKAEKLLGDLVASHESHSRDELLSKCFTVLDTDNLGEIEPGESREEFMRRRLPHTIFVPPIGERGRAEGSEPAVYGTQKQTVILVDRKGHATFVERTLFDNEMKAVQRGEGDRKYEFEIEGW